MIIIAMAIWYSGEAQAKTTGELLDNCKHDQEPALYSYCVGYVMGAAEAQLTSDMFHKGIDSSFPGFFCPPNNVTGSQVAAIFVKYATDHPEAHHLQADWIVTAAMTNAFPCRPK